MAHTPGTTARVQRLTSLVAIVFVAIAIGLAFGRVYQGHAITYRLIAVAALSGVAAWAFERRSLLLATLVSGVLLLLVLGWLVFPDSLRFGVPTMQTLREMAKAAAAVGEEARVQVSPTPPTRALLFAGITAVWAAVFSCHALAFRAGSPLLALVPPVALVAFADSVLDDFDKPIYGVLFLVAGLAVVFADSLRRVQGWGPVWSWPGRSGRLLPATGPGARKIAGVAVVLAAVAPFVVPGFGAKAVIDLSSINSDGITRLSPLVSIGAKLSDDADPEPEFAVQTDHASYWRMIGLEQYNGTTWEQANEDSLPVGPGASLPDEPTAASEVVTQQFTALRDLGFVWLPAAPDPVSVNVDADVQTTWGPESQTITLNQPLRQGQAYTVESVYPAPTAEELRAAKTPSVPALTDIGDIPADVRATLTDIALDWTAGKTTPFDQAWAIQEHLLDPKEFTYDTGVDYRDDPQALVDFLTKTKRGFCQQFASAMAVLLRLIDVPARVAFGFVRGAKTGADTYEVTSDQLHSWVEVPFNGKGWIPFEPTIGDFHNPTVEGFGVKTGSPQGTGGDICVNSARYMPSCSKGNGADSPSNSVSVSVPPSSPGSFATATPVVGPSTERSRGPWVVAGLIFLIGLLGLGSVPLVQWMGRRRKLRRAARHPRTLILATYDVFTQRAAELGLGRSRGETLDEYRRRAVQSDRLTDGHLDRLTRVTARAAYAPQEPSEGDVLDATADALEVLRQLRQTAPLRSRLLAPFHRS
jgi:hypothetical protein